MCLHRQSKAKALWHWCGARVAVLFAAAAAPPLHQQKPKDRCHGMTRLGMKRCSGSGWQHCSTTFCQRGGAFKSLTCAASLASLEGCWLLHIQP